MADWFSDLFPDIDTSGNVDYGTGGDPGSYSGASYDQMFEQTFGGTGADTSAYTPTYDTSGGGGGGGGGQDSASVFANIGDFVTGAQNTVSGWWDEAVKLGEKLFTNPEQTTTQIDPLTKKPVQVTTAGGGLNSLGQLLISGAIQGLGQGQVMKWQAERASKEKQKERNFEREKRAEDFSRKPYGGAPQLAPKMGTGLIRRAS